MPARYAASGGFLQAGGSISTSALATAGSSTPAFSPTDVTGLQLFLDPTAGITMDGSNRVSAWADTQSGSGRTATQSTNASKFVYTANTFGTRPGLRATAASSQDMAISSTITGLTAFTICILFRPVSTTLQQLVGANAPWAINSSASFVSEVYDGTSYADFDDVYSADTDYLWIIRSGTAPTSATCLRNGVSLTRVAQSGASWNLAVTGLGSRLSARYANGYYGPILVYNSSLSDVDVASIRAWYTAQGWGSL
jgi:hypothetical protein